MEKEPSHSQLLRSRWNDFRSRCQTGYAQLHPNKPADFARRTEFKEREEERKRKFENHEMSKEEVLHYLRGERESEHRGTLKLCFEYFAFCWSSKPIHGPCLDKKARFRRARSLGTSLKRDFIRLHNKSVPLYVLTSSRLGDLSTISKVHVCLQRALCCYLYDKWFYPYHSNIDFHQFITNIIVPMDLECCDIRPSAALVDDIIEINGEIVSYVKTVKDEMVKGAERDLAEGKDHRRAPESINQWWKTRKVAPSPDRLRNHYSVPALFKSLGVILCTEAWEETGPSEIGNTPVCMFLTGVKDSGLSAPITFTPIQDKIQAVLQRGPKTVVQTTLNTAVDFVMELEAREASAAARSSSGPASRKDYPKPNFPEAYNHYFEGVTEWGPSSEWIDSHAYEEWTGSGADVDLDYSAMEEFERMSELPQHAQIEDTHGDSRYRLANV